MDRSHALSVLGLKENATLKDIKSAYRAKAKLLHPDKGGSEVAFIELNNAYGLLTGRKQVRKPTGQHGQQWVWVNGVATRYVNPFVTERIYYVRR